MKRILIAAAIVALIIVACRWPGVDQRPPREPANPWQGPPASPSAAGCSCSITALGTSLVDAMSWTNAGNGHMGSGATTIHPEFGSTFFIITDPSINCSSNSPNVAAASFTCHGTNMPQAIAIQLPPNCNGVKGAVNGDCQSCVFSISIDTNAFWCNIYGPRK